MIINLDGHHKQTVYVNGVNGVSQNIRLSDSIRTGLVTKELEGISGEESPYSSTIARTWIRSISLVLNIFCTARLRSL